LTSTTTFLFAFLAFLFDAAAALGFMLHTEFSRVVTALLCGVCDLELVPELELEATGATTVATQKLIQITGNAGGL